MNRFIFTFLFFVNACWSASSRAQMNDPSVVWEQIETPHFIIVYDSRHYPLADLYARFAEQAYLSTEPAFGLAPRKTVLVLNDRTDAANGFATGVPYPMMTAFPVLPNALDSIGDYGNWGLELITHEYVHILTFEPATGTVKPLRWIFGNIIRPNILLPRWYLEGLAVEMETRYSKFGRLRSANYLSIPRAMVEEGTLFQEDIARINENIPDWPGGIRPYLMGSLLWNEMTRQKGDSIIGELNLAYSKRVPFFINGPVEDRFGTDYAGLLAQVYHRAETNARRQIDEIQAAGRMTEVKFAQEGFFNHSPVVSPDGKFLAYVSRVHNVDSAVILAERPHPNSAFRESKPIRVSTGTSISRISWTPDSTSLVFDSIDTFDRYYEYSDLYKYDLASKKKRQLTKGMRSREPAISPDGRYIVFVQNVPGSTQLSAISATGDDYHVLYTPSAQTRISRPEFLSSNELIFTEKSDNGTERFKVMTIKVDDKGLLSQVGETRDVLTDYQPVHSPRLTKEGLLFTSDRSGVANLYLANSDLTQARAVSNTTTRLMTGEIDPVTGDLLYSRLTAAGPQIHSTPRDQWSQSPSTLPQVGPLVDYEWPEFEPPQLELETRPEPYDPFPHLLPRYWLPFVYVIPGGSYFQASTSSSDPVGRHSYGLSISYDTLTNKAGTAVSYTNRSTRVPFTVAGEDFYEYLYSADIVRHSTSARLTGSFFLAGLSEDWLGGFGWRYLQTHLTSGPVVRNGIMASLSWKDASQKGLEISPEKGGAFRLSHTRFLPEVGTIGYELTEANGSYFFSKWLPERHVLAFFSNAVAAPGLGDRNLLLGTSTVSGGYQNTLISSGLIMRGYNSGVFIGRNMLSTTVEYRFPLSYSYQGFGTKPFFIKRWHGDLFVDSLTLDGVSYDFDSRGYRTEKLGTFFLGTGAEVKADATLFYHLPVQFVLGMYYGLDRKANPVGLIPFIGFGL